MANAGSELKKVRGCYDGGSFKLLESHKTPVKLEGLPSILDMTNPGDEFCKLDDVKGFLLAQLHPESRDLVVIKFKGRFLRFWDLAFGERKSPAVFQRINSIVVNFLRSQGFTLSLYLDDRFCLERLGTKVNGKDIPPSVGRTTFLSILVLIATGAYLNLEKSIFTPTHKEEFLGMTLNSKTCVISIPEKKLIAFRELILDIETSEKCTLEQLEIARGVACSFILAVDHLKLFIRQMTKAIRAVNVNFPDRPHKAIAKKLIPVSLKLKAELREWRKCTILTTEQCWIPQQHLYRKIALLYTDASQAQGGAVLYIGQTKVAVWKCPFPESTHEYTIARLETLTILLAIVEFRKYLRNVQIVNLCDNQNSVFAFDKDGSSDSRINDLVIRIIDQVRKLKSQIQVIWLPTKYQLADEPSRDIRKSEEFLPMVHFKFLESLAGIKLHVDCMATQANAKCPEYVGLKPTELENTVHFDHTKQIFLDFNQLRPTNVTGKNLYIFPPKNYLSKVAALLRRHFMDHPFVLLFHRWDELPLAITPLLNHKKSILVLLSDNKAITYFPAENNVILKQYLDGSDILDPIHIRGQPNVRPRSVMAIFHACKPCSSLQFQHNYWKMPSK